MSMLQEGWCDRAAERQPYVWTAFNPGECLEWSAAVELAATFPVEGFKRLDESGRTNGKRYKNHCMPLDTKERLSRLPDAWHVFVDELLASTYRCQVAALLEQRPASALELRLVQHEPGDWLEQHTDGPDKLFSHVFYFNAVWGEDWGGTFDILSSADPSSTVAHISPKLGAAVLLKRCGESWHGVAPVSPHAQARRLSFLVHGLA